MTDSDKKPEAPKEHPAMGQIVGYLKDYPFLLITIAGLLILSGILIFDLEKLKEFKWLIYAVVLVPLGIQFLIEFKKMSGARVPSSPYPDHEQHAVGNQAREGGPVPVPGPAPLGKKAWLSIAISMVLFGLVSAFPETEAWDRSFALGFLVAALVAAGFSIAAIMDVNHRRTGGWGTAITSAIFSGVMVLAGLGWMAEDHGSPVIATDVPLGGADLPPAIPAPANVLAPPTQPQPPVALAPGMEGRYQLLGHHVDGEPAASGGSLALRQQSPERYEWRVQLSVPGFGTMQSLSYGGWFQLRGGRWFMRITGSNDPNWQDAGEVPMDVVFDGRNAAFTYVYDGDHIQSAWTRSN